MTTMISDIDVSDFSQLADAWQRAPQIVLDEFERAITVASGMLHAEIIDRTPVGASGGSGAGLSGSIHWNVTRSAADVSGVVGTASPYAQAVELGTKPHHPPVAPLVDWVMSRLGVDDQGDALGVAWRIAKKIARRGTKGQHMFRDSVGRLTPDFNREMQRAAQRTLDRLETVA